MGDKEQPARLDFAAKEELLPCLGTPDIDIALFSGGMLWALTFGGKENRLSIEHGLCAIFEGETLSALIDYTDFPHILRWWDDYKKHNILTMPPRIWRNPMTRPQKETLVTLLRKSQTARDYRTRCWLPFQDYLDPSDPFTAFACEPLD